MLKKSTIVILGIIVFSFFVVIILYAFSAAPISEHQHFSRLYRQGVVQQRNLLDIGGNSYYIAGVAGNKLFLGNKKDSLDLLITDLQLSTTQHVILHIAEEENIKLKGSRIEIDSPFFYIKAGGLPGIFKGKLNEWQATRILNKIPFFTQGTSLKGNSFAIQTTLREPQGKGYRNVLGTISDTLVARLNPAILEGQVDNFFTTMGSLRYSKMLKQLIYIYDYRNQYLVMDTSLNILYKGKTIDHTEQAMINPVEVKEGHFELASPPAVVNWMTQVDKNLMFVNSNQMASNDERLVFDAVSVIDVYDIETNKYQFSFRLSNYENIKMSNFMVNANCIIALYGRYVISYSFNWNDSEI